MEKEIYFIVEANNVNYDVGLSGPFSLEEACVNFKNRFNELLQKENADIEAVNFVKEHSFITENSFRVTFENDDMYYGYIKKIIEGEDDK